MIKLNLVQPLASVKMSLIFLGVWHYDAFWFPLYRIYTFLLHVSVTVLFSGLTYINIVETNNIGNLSENLFVPLTVTGVLIKVYNLLIYGPFLIKLLKKFENENFQPKNEEEYLYMKKAFKNFTIFKHFFVGVSFCFIFSSFGVPFTSEDDKLPFPAWFPFDWKTKENFRFAYSYEVLSGLLICLLNVQMDVLQTFLLFQVGNFYELIGMRLSKLGLDREKHETDLAFENKVLKGFFKDIESHQLVAELAQNTEIFISQPVFVQNSLSTLVICVSAYQLNMTSPSENLAQFIMLIYYLLALSIQIFLPCFYGELVTTKSMLLINCLYNSNWYNLPLKCQKLALIYMEYLKTPVIIKAGKLYFVSLTTFTKTMNNAYSLYAVLKNANVK